jgi:predicted naringenin-chalcone synthase
MEERTKVTILTSTYRIRGYIELLPGARISDFMAESRDFIAVTNAEVWELHPGGRQVAAASFINVSRDHIEVILPGH